ncbi:hypothetical protein CPB85DRAFT_1541142, partial [Mucidula mucida]
SLQFKLRVRAAPIIESTIYSLTGITPLNSCFSLSHHMSLVYVFFLSSLVSLCISIKRPPVRHSHGAKGLALHWNVLDMPTEGKDWLTYAEWGRKYGVSVRSLSWVDLG